MHCNVLLILLVLADGLVHWIDVDNIDERFYKLSEFMLGIVELLPANLCESDSPKK